MIGMKLDGGMESKQVYSERICGYWTGNNSNRPSEIQQGTGTSLNF